jgi:pyridoxal phosphate enzyme (YggS family)
MSIAENLAQIEESIQKACSSAGRKREEITLMGVTKFLTGDKVEEAYNAGIRCFGESRVKEAAEKFGLFKASHPIQLHLIGGLQRNKAKTASPLFDCVQSIDREEIIAELEKHSAEREKPLEVLLELHTGEETKSGFAELDAVFKAAQMVLESKFLKVRGLMTMAPFTQDTQLIRASFRQVVKTQKELERRFPPKENWECLSMGMSNDFEIAVEEGSTMIRIGSLLFKE